jgi:hypothetical protein
MSARRRRGAVAPSPFSADSLANQLEALADGGPATMSEYVFKNAESLALQQLTSLGMPAGPWPDWQKRLVDEYIASLKQACLCKIAAAPEAASPLPAVTAVAAWYLWRDSRNSETENLANAAETLEISTETMRRLMDEELCRMAQLRHDSPATYEARLSAIIALGKLLSDPRMPTRIIPHLARLTPRKPASDHTEAELAEMRLLS